MSSIDSASRAERTAAVRSRTSSRHRQPFGSGSVERNTGASSTRSARGEGAREVVLKDTAARRSGARLEDGPDARVRIASAQAGERLGDRGRMMREVVVDRDAAGDADDFEASFDAGERAQPFDNPLDGLTPASVATAIAASAFRTLCAPTSGDLELPNGVPWRRTLKRVVAPAGSISCACQSSAFVRAERLDARDGLLRRRARARAVGADEQQAVARHEVHEAAEREHHGVEVGVDVGVIELDVVDDGDVGQILQELRGLVEERAVVTRRPR